MQRTAIVVLGVVVLAQMSERPDVIVVLEPAPLPESQPQPPPQPQPQPQPPPQPQPQPQPQPIAKVAGDSLGPCPAPYTRGTDAEITGPSLDETMLDIEGMTASAFDVRLLAVWDGDHVLVSVDEGRSWNEVLQNGGIVDDALFDCHGRLHVLFDDGELGTYDDASDEPSEWQRAAAFPDSSDRGRLVLDGHGVAALGPDLAFPDRLIVARRDARGSWRSQPLVDDPEYGSWDGISIEAIEPAGKGRFRMLAMPWQGGECGYSRYLDVRFDLDAKHVTVRQVGEELPEKSWWRTPEIENVAHQARDAAGRWILALDEHDHDHPIVRRSRPTGVIEDDAGSD